MITISLCMIVKNEEAVLARCLDSVADLMDEIIIVDTGSSDRTKDIAKKYTDKIYDFQWIDDFSAARNFAFEKAQMEYIYSADADEVVDSLNRELFSQLKENLLSEIDIVQMKYGNQLSHGTVYNYDEELRPKLFKRLRNFVWQEAIHEQVRLSPIVFDSEITITHLPTSNHAKRDILNFEKQIRQGQTLSKRLHNMYARELFLAGEDQDFLNASAFFEESVASPERSEEETVEAACVAAKAARLRKDTISFFKQVCKVIAGEGCSEVCYEMGLFYEEQGEYEEAIIWFYNAAYETTPVLSLKTQEIYAKEGLVRCYRSLSMEETASMYEQELYEAGLHEAE
ncbi:glycosyltransferase family 2 protein [Lachnospiraceae bacterium OttesenSCG-928-D06]|nr:glycosyltransferase family 2 protein [Lachnospiraceae bacterium OttesenSCG-928-D06]